MPAIHTGTVDQLLHFNSFNIRFAAIAHCAYSFSSESCDMKDLSPRDISRSLAKGVLVSMLFFYAVHVLGKWTLENYQPNPETTATVLLHNKCAILGREHTLRPNTAVPAMDAGINGTKLSGSFMNFTDGHIPGMVVVCMLTGGLLLMLRRAKLKNF